MAPRRLLHVTGLAALAALAGAMGPWGGVAAVAAADGACPTTTPPFQVFATPAPARDPALAATIPVGRLPIEVVVDSSDVRGRIFVSSSGSGTVSIFEARATNPADVRLVADIPAGIEPGPLALDADTGLVAVASLGDCTIRIIAGRADPPRVVASVPLSTTPAGMAIDPDAGQLFVAEPRAGRMAWRGGLLLLAAALLAWFARVPFQPAVGETSAGLGLAANKSS